VVAGPAGSAAPIRLLIVDDEPSLLDLLRRYLERLGFAVDVASTPEAALEQFEADSTKYDCVVTDLKLPGMSGEDMLERMRSLRPGLRALISSGSPHQPLSRGTAFLQKPYLPAMLAEELERILGVR
jgi:DNA-binding response OmpR family regulator